MMPPIIVENLSKQFQIGFEKKPTILGRVLALFSGVKTVKTKVLSDVSFQIEKGEVLGIIGLNGSGKSTLLRIIAGIYSPDSGLVRTSGKMVYLSGFGQGIKKKLTMKDNIFLVGSLMGLNQKEIKERMGEIIEFSELKDYLDVKVNKFSSGMVSRLNFSIGIHCLAHRAPDIFLLDEVFSSGGDIKFEQKAINKMEQLISGGATVILVTHDLNLLRKCCHRALVLKNGSIVKAGKPDEVAKYYANSL